MEEAVKECPRCRAELFQGAHFCMHCGMRLEGRAAIPSSTRIKAPAPPPARKERPTYTGYSVTTPRTKAR